MTWLAGVDGCKRGWFRASRNTDTGELHFAVSAQARELLTTAPVPSVLTIDIPIGLPAAGSRDCDIAARAHIGPRRSSVFPAPIRPALGAESHDEASEITAKADGRRVGVQSWAIFPKIREVDELLASDAPARAAIREVHPEVCFWAWNDKKPMEWHKRKAAGRAERLGLVERWLGTGVLERARGAHLKKHLADDDILDAIAGLWTAHRIADGTAETLPTAPPCDGTGLPMEMVF